MAELEVVGDELLLRLSGFEKAAALHRDLRFPVSAITTIEVVDTPFALVKGFRAAGLSIPKRVAIGTFRRPGMTQFIVLKGAQPAVRVSFTRGSISALLIGTANAEATAERLRTDAGR